MELLFSLSFLLICGKQSIRNAWQIKFAVRIRLLISEEYAIYLLCWSRSSGLSTTEKEDKSQESYRLDSQLIFQAGIHNVEEQSRYEATKNQP